MAKLAMDDIADLRAYEREREEFRTRVIALKKRRRVHVGPVITLVFENRDTIRFQIQEMARVEKLISDEAIQTELDVYNPLISDTGQVSATLFIELTSDDQLREWLPRLVGIESAPMLRLGDGEDVLLVRCTVDAEHEAQLTRETVTAAVHYVRWQLTPEQVEAFAAGPVTLVIDHPQYPYEEPLGPDTVTELLTDLHGS
jgi:hypothetical protein